jgi:hypothetical protein
MGHERRGNPDHGASGETDQSPKHLLSPKALDVPGQPGLAEAACNRRRATKAPPDHLTALVENRT